MPPPRSRGTPTEDATYRLGHQVHHILTGKVSGRSFQTVGGRDKDYKDLVDKLQEIVIEEGGVIASFNVTALFTSVHNEVVEMAIKRATSDHTWNERTLLTPEKFGDLLKIVIKTTYFRFQGKIYEKTLACAWVHYSHMACRICS